MGAKAMSGKVRGAAREHGAKAARGRGAATAPKAWEQTAEVPDDRAFEIDCQRVVQGEGSRGLPLYYDDYN